MATYKWVKTRRCACGWCTHHEPSKPGWAVCPNTNKPDFDEKAIWLYRRDSNGD